MGEAADRKVTEIEETRRRIEADLRELEDRIPAPFRSTKSLAGLVLGSTALTALLLREEPVQALERTPIRGGDRPHRPRRRVSAHSLHRPNRDRIRSWAGQQILSPDALNSTTRS